MAEPVRLNGADLTVRDVVSVARDGLMIDLDVEALTRVASSSRLLHALRESDGIEFDLTETASEISRAGVVVRVNQLLADGSGAATETILGLARLLLDDDVANDSLIVPEAVVDGRIALVAQAFDHYLDAALLVTALGWNALGLDLTVIDERVLNSRPHPGAISVARSLRTLLDGSDGKGIALGGYREFATVSGTFWEKVWDLHAVLAVELNATSADALVVTGDFTIEWDHTPVMIVLDSVRLALARLVALVPRRCALLGCEDPQRERIIADLWRAAEPAALRVDQPSSLAAAMFATLRCEAMLEHAWSLLAIEASAAVKALGDRRPAPKLTSLVNRLRPLRDRFEIEATLRPNAPTV